MERQNVIVYEPETGTQVFGSLKRLCDANKLPYHTLKSKKFPFEWKGATFQKVPFNSI